MYDRSRIQYRENQSVSDSLFLYFIHSVFRRFKLSPICVKSNWIQCPASSICRFDSADEREREREREREKGFAFTNFVLLCVEYELWFSYKYYEVFSKSILCEYISIICVSVSMCPYIFCMVVLVLSYFTIASSISVGIWYQLWLLLLSSLLLSPVRTYRQNWLTYTIWTSYISGTYISSMLFTNGIAISWDCYGSCTR